MSPRLRSARDRAVLFVVYLLGADAATSVTHLVIRAIPPIVTPLQQMLIIIDASVGACGASWWLSRRRRRRDSNRGGTVMGVGTVNCGPIEDGRTVDAILAAPVDLAPVGRRLLPNPEERRRRHLRTEAEL